TPSKKPIGKAKEDLTLEKKTELEKRLQDMSGHLNHRKKPNKKGKCSPPVVDGLLHP
ncbi:hypothetical protein chiPu_0026126, partial [Chiloscyllium punctatum]|nr:hypothetical protein [Chiloscyllium punctatum]